ncbi:equilibrative nucleotide transporter 8-like [Aristolochia californica]|uniref:equilibrative nucleotide transporter 8-like n=1 Tax=Aristolochia californica TaxID=171875 RepID=UPI0035E13676
MECAVPNRAKKYQTRRVQSGNLLPWNALITAVDYFGNLYPGKHVNKVFSVAYMGSSLPVLVVLVSLSKCSRKPGVKLRMNLGFSLFVVALLTIPIMDWACQSGDRRWNKAYTVTIMVVTICGLADGLIGGTLIGSVGELPKRYMQATFAGTASSGVLLAFLRIITKGSVPQTPQGLRTSAHVYFIVSIIIVQGCIVFYNILDRLPVIKYHRKETHCQSTTSTNTETNAAELKLQPKVWDVWKRIQWLAFGLVVIYTVTLSIFPGFITENVNSKLLRDWYPILLITTYNVSDLVGKCLTTSSIPKNTKKVTWFCVARVLFYPLFAASLHGPPFFRMEIPIILLTSGLGLTNGYLTSSVMILATKIVSIEEAETAGILMALFLGIGLVGGSVLGWFWII